MSIISVIIPAYNAEKTIKKTIESVINQNFNDWEGIVINDGSTDSTLDVIFQIKDPRLKVFSYPNAGAAASRNRGLSKATGEFITFLDADDVWTPDKLELQYKILEKHPDAAVAYSWTNVIDENDNFLYAGSYAKWTGDVYLQLLLDDFIGSGSNVMVRKRVFEKVGVFEESLPNAEDTDMWLRLAAHYHFVVVQSPQILYRLSSTSKSSTNLIRLENSNLKIIERAFSHKKAASYQHLRQYAIANLYKYLSHKALSIPSAKYNSLQTSIFLCKAISTDPLLLIKPIIYKALLKLLILTLLPSTLTKMILDKFPRLSNTSTFFGYIKSNFP